MTLRTKGQPDTVSETTLKSTPSIPGSTDTTEATKLGTIDNTTLATAESLVEKGAKMETDILKLSISSGAIMCGQGRLFGKAKNVLRNKQVTDKEVERIINDLYAKFDLAKSTMNRRIQLWDEAVSRGIINEDLRHEIEKSFTFTAGLLNKLEADIGSISGTALMRELGILPALEQKPKVTKAKSLKEKIGSTLDAMLKQLDGLINGKNIRDEINDDNVIDEYRDQLRQLRVVANKLNAISKTPPAVEQESAPPSDESSQSAVMERQNIRHQKKAIDAEESTRDLAEV